MQVCLARALERGKTSGRSDDNPASLAKRIQTYMSETVPIIQYYAARNMLRTVDARPSADEVFAAVRKLFTERKA